MRIPLLLRWLAVFLTGILPVCAAHPFLCCDHNGGRVAMVGADGRVQWEYACKAPQDCWRLANGNTVFANYLGHGHIGEQPQVFEVTRDKKLVWQFRGDPGFKTINQIHLLDVPDDPARGEIHR